MKKPPKPAAANEADAIRNQYAALGVAAYYRQYAASYENPHLPQVQGCLAWALAHLPPPGRYLDLACGNGACTSYLQSQDHAEATGCDPYFSDVYAARCGAACHPLSFEQLATQGLPATFDTVFCSYALHLCPASYFEPLLYALSVAAPRLVVISPSKFPLVPATYWQLTGQVVLQRAHCRLFSRLAQP